jgi:hypothetical protein
MVVILMTKNNSFKLIFKDQDNQLIDINYKLHDSIVAEKWFKKIKHLKNIPIDNNESNLVNLDNLKDIYIEFCNFAKITPIYFQNIDQKLLNNLHKIYEQTHEILSKKNNNSILYKFHHSIHFHESDNSQTAKEINVGWGVKEGPLTENFYCNKYYESSIVKNNIYLPWSELGKTPLAYWENKEPNDQKRFNELAKPHITFRAKFFVATSNNTPAVFDSKFINWFNSYKKSWFEHYKIDKWDHIDEHSAPLLAITDQKDELIDCNFLSIEV